MRAGFAENEDEYRDVPDPEAEPEKYRIIEWQMQPGNAVLFDFRTVHGARANMTQGQRLRQGWFPVLWSAA
ncbi:MAG: phytanoyl-CoA dioxygenase family protein [Alphaproteobacteria bacterium]